MKPKRNIVMLLLTILMCFGFSFVVHAKEESVLYNTDSLSIEANQEETKPLETNETSAEKTQSQEKSVVQENTSEAKKGSEETQQTKTSEESVPAKKENETEENTTEKNVTADVQKTGTEEKQTAKENTETTSEDTKGEKATDSKYTVEFKHNDLQYVLEGNKSVKLSKILDKVKIEGKNIEKVECSDESLFSASKKSGEWIISSHKPFSSQEWMKVTVDGTLYNITVTDASLITSCAYARGSLKCMNYTSTANAKMEWFFDYENGVGSIEVNAYDTTEVQTIGEGQLSGSENFFWVTGYKTTADGNMIDVKSQNKWLDKSLITKAKILKYIGNIGKHMFASCTNLKEVNIATDKLTSIDANAFEGCTSLQTVYIPSNVSAIGTKAFNNTPNNMEIFIDKTEAQFSTACSDKIYISGDSGSRFPNAPNQKFFYKCGNALYYNIKNNTATIKKCSLVSGDCAMNDYSEYQSPLYIHRTEIQTLVISDATSIGNYAFCDCNVMTGVTLPSSVTSMGYSAFRRCSSLTSINLEATQITKILQQTFQDDDNLATIIIPAGVDSIGNNAFKISNDANIYCKNSYSKTNLAAQCPDSKLSNAFPRESSQNFYFQCGNNLWYTVNGSAVTVSAYPTNASDKTMFNNWAIPTPSSDISPFRKLNSETAITSVNLGAATSVGQYAFLGCTSIATVTISDSVTTIGQNAFYDCDSITTLTIPSTVTSIGSHAFDSCSSLVTLKINPNAILGRIGQEAFDFIKQSAKIYYYNTETKRYNPEGDFAAECYGGAISGSFSNGRFYEFYYRCGDQLWYTFSKTTNDNDTLTISKGPDSSGSAMWNYAANNGPFYAKASTLTTINISDATTIGTRSFQSCTGITSITIPSSVTTLNDSCFKYCDGLTDVTIPSNVSTIEAGAFYRCLSLENLTILGSSTSIGAQAFDRCANLATVTISSGVTSIGQNAFNNLKSGADIYYANTATYKTNPEADLESKCYSDGTDTNGKIYNSFGRTVDSTAANHYVFHFKCGDTLWYTFSKTTNANDTVIISKGPDAAGSAMWNYTIDGGSPFRNNADTLTTVNISDAITVGTQAFRGCAAITATVTIPSSVTTLKDSCFKACTGLTSMIIPGNVVTVEAGAFWSCTGMTSLTLKNGVKTVGASAFDNCTKLATVIIPASIANTTSGDTTTYGLGSAAFTRLKAGANIYYEYKNQEHQVETQFMSICYNGAVTNSFTYGLSDSNANHYNFHFYCGGSSFYTIDGNGVVTIKKDPGVTVTTGTTWDLSDDSTSATEYYRDGPFYRHSASGNTGFAAPAITSLVVSEGISDIGKHLFRDCTGLTSITFSGTLADVRDNAFYNCDGLKTLTIPNTVAYIKKYAFKDCSNLAIVEIYPNANLEIGQDTFKNLKSSGVDIYYHHDDSTVADPKVDLANRCYGDKISGSFDTTAAIHFKCGDNLWYGLSGTNDSIATISVYPSNAADKTMWNWVPGDEAHPTPSPFTQMAGTLKEVNTGDASTIGSYAFENCTSMVSAEITNKVTAVGTQAFYGCSNLGTVTIQPNANLAIGLLAFKNIAATADVYFEGIDTQLTAVCDNDVAGRFDAASVYNTGENGKVFHFKCGDNLWYTIQNSTATISKDTATGDNLDMWNWSENDATHPTPSPFTANSGSITALAISDAKTIGTHAFEDCAGITGVTIPKSVITVGDYSFYNCSLLENLTISSNTKTIGDDAFGRCTVLNSFEIPSTVETIGCRSFKDCNTKLTDLEIPNSATTIGEDAFSGCSNLGTVIIRPNENLAIGASAFKDVAATADVYFEGSDTQFATACGDNVANRFDVTSVYNTGENGKLFHFRCGNNLWYTIQNNTATICKDIATGEDMRMLNWTLAVPSPFTAAADEFQSVVISDATTVGTYAFDGCANVASVTIPATVTSIGVNAFNDCSNLANVEIPTSVVGIGASSFTNLKASADIHYAGKQAAFEAKCATSIANCFGYAVGAENGYLFHFTQSISYVPNDGTMPDPLAPVSYETNGGNSVVLAVPTRDRYNFDGWCTDAALQTVPIKSFAADNTQFGDKTFYAKWTINPCAIIYYCRGGSIATPTVTGYVPGSGETLTLDTPTYEGHAFRGWHQDELLNDDATLTFAVGNNTEDVSFYADWYNCEPVTYWRDDELQTISNYEVVKDCETTLGKEGQETWYVLVNDVDFNEGAQKRLTVLGDVHLVLNDGCELYSSGINVDKPNSLTVYAQENDTVYNAPMDTSNVELKEMTLLTNEYTVVGNKRYYRYYMYDSDYGEQDYFYNLETDTVYEYGRNGYELSPTLSKMELLAVPKNYPQFENGYVDDNGEAYVWNEVNLQNGKGLYEPCQQDNSEDGYVYFQGPYNELELSAENTTTYFLGYFSDLAGQFYYLDHDDAVAPGDYEEGVCARNGDYVYSLADPSKKYYYSSFEDGIYTFTLSDNGELEPNAETVTLIRAGTDAGATYCYVDRQGVRHYPRDEGEEEFYLDSRSAPEEELYYPIIALNKYGEYSDLAYHYIRHYFSKTLFRQPVQGVLYCLDDPTTNAAIIGSSDIDVSSGAITINGGDIRILRDHSAVSLGSAGKTENNPNEVTTGDITICGGKFTYYPVTIGGGENMSGGNITIQGGQILADRIGAGAYVDRNDDTTNLSIAWTNKTDFIKLFTCWALPEFAVDDDHKFVLGGKLMIDGNSVINSKEDLPHDAAYLIPYYPVNYTMTIPGSMALPFGFVSGKFGTDDVDSLDLATADESSVATYPYGLSVIINKNHFSKIRGRDNNGNNIYDADNTLEYSLSDEESGDGAVNKCLIISNGNDHMNYVNGAESALGGNDNMDVSVNDVNKWNTLAPGFYGSNVTFTVGLSTAGCYPFDQEDVRVFDLH